MLRKQVSCIAMAWMLLGLYVWGLSGCQPGSTGPEPQSVKTEESNHAHGDHGHDHPSHGPHGGELIELGQEEYHLEFLHDEAAQRVRLFLLDGTAKQPATSTADNVTLNIKTPTTAAQFRLPAIADDGDSTGTAYHTFELIDAELNQLLDAAGAVATVVLSINGKQYRGELRHDHAGHAN